MWESLEVKSMLVHSKKTSPFILARNRIYLGTHLKKELTDLFTDLLTDRVDRDW